MEKVETIFGEKIPCKRIVAEYDNVAVVEDSKNERHVVHLNDMHRRKESKKRTARQKRIASDSFDLEGTKKRGRTGRAGRARRF